MCGPSGNEKSLEGQQAQFSQTLQNSYQNLFGEQQGVLQNLNNIYSPIAEAGPSQQGFSPQQLAAENTQAIDTTGQNYASAARAINGQLAGRGGDSGLESGVDAQLKGNLASTAAGTLSNEQLGITNANYAQGNKNWQDATAGLQALGTQYSPNAAATAGIGANTSAFSESNQIAQQEAQEQQAIGSAIGVGAEALTGGISGGLTALNASPAGASQPGAFTQGFLSGF